MVDRTRRWLLAGLVLGLGAAWVILSTRGEDAREPTLDAAATTPDAAVPIPRRADDLSVGAIVRTRDRSSAAEDEVLLRVVSTAEEPIPGASVCEHRRSRWGAAQDLRTPHARADAEGLIRLSTAETPLEELWVYAAGYCPRAIGGLQPGREYEVRLESGAALEVRTETIHGAPLAGVLVCVARRALPHPESPFYERARAGETRPGLDPELAIHTALSDERGFARIEGLLPGEFHLRGSHPVLMQIHEEGVERAAVPGESKTLRFCRVAYDAFEVAGDRALSSGVEYLPARRMIGTLRTMSFVTEIEARLAREFPTATTCVVALDEPESSPPPSVIFDLWLERAGSRRFVRPLRFYEGEFTLQTIPTPEGDEREERGALEVSVRDRLDRELAVDFEFIAKRAGEQAPSLAVRSTSGAALPLPVCKGTLRSPLRAQPFVQAREVEIGPGQRAWIETRLPVAVRRCELALVLPFADAFDRGSVFVHADHGLAGSVRLHGAQPTTSCYLPEGRSELRVFVPGFEDAVVAVEVPVTDAAIDPPLRVEVALRASR
jgi:hypothetical protein